MNKMHNKISEEQVITILKTIFDPEIPANIYDMGFIYEINIDENNNIKVLMTLTAPNCPVAESLPIEVKQALDTLPDVGKTEIELTFEPPWDTDMMSPSAKLELGML